MTAWGPAFARWASNTRGNTRTKWAVCDLMAMRSWYHLHELSVVSTALSSMTMTFSLSKLISESFNLPLRFLKLAQQWKNLASLHCIDSLFISTNMLLQFPSYQSIWTLFLLSWPIFAIRTVLHSFPHVPVILFLLSWLHSAVSPFMDLFSHLIFTWVILPH